MKELFFILKLHYLTIFVVVLFSIRYLALGLQINHHSGVLALLSACIGYIMRGPKARTKNDSNLHCFISIVSPGVCSITPLLSQVFLNKEIPSRASRIFCTFTNIFNLITNHFYWDVHAERYQSNIIRD